MPELEYEFNQQDRELVFSEDEFSNFTILF